ncbi:disulfide bond formation protein B [Uliginosibacterium sp. sgz301328]|uniref:disulfide bond formation protein B n=1 Tax=Uliginosibacterium sp. sgz301328 TaxID=3243764 RepID=UPI00359D631E
MINRLSNRFLFLSVFFGCAVLLAIAFYLQLVEGIEPCPMCILQRYGLVACGLVALIAGLHNPNPRGWGPRAYGLLLAACAIAAGGVAARQTWLQHNPPSISTCGPGLEYMVSRFPLADLLPRIFQGSGDCSVVDWKMFGLSLAEWGLVTFTVLCVFGLWQTFRKRA